MTTHRSNIIIADSQFLIVESLKMLINSEKQFNLIGIASNTIELKNLLLVNSEKKLVIIDYNLMGFENFEEFLTFRKQYMEYLYLALSNKFSKNELLELSKAEINNVLLKTDPKEDILSCIDATLKNKKYYSQDILDILLENNGNKHHGMSNTILTASEIEIVRLIAEGKTTKEIAAYKNISFHTANTHRKNIFKKLQINNSSELVMYGIKAGLIDSIEYYI